MGGEFHECAKCLCHSVSGCDNRMNCAKYSISKSYWRDAGSPTLQSYSSKNDDTKYKKCMKDENCILNTIKTYTDDRMKVIC